MILRRLQLWLRRRKPIEKFTVRDWALIDEVITKRIEREHPAEVKAIRAQVDVEMGRLKQLAMHLAGTIH
jgi:hypothetical protein